MRRAVLWIVSLAIGYQAFVPLPAAGRAGEATLSFSEGVGLPERPARRAEALVPGSGRPGVTAASWLESWALSGQRPRTGRSSALASSVPSGDFAVTRHVDSVSQTEDLDAASIAYNPTRGEYLVVWHALVRESSTNVYARRLSSSGAPIGNTFTISAAPGVQGVPDVAYESTGATYWVTWTDFGGGEVPDVKLRRVSADGALLGSEITVNGPVNEAFASRIACGSGRCVVAWQNVEADGDSHVLIQGFEASGARFAPILLLTDPVGVAAQPDICFNAHDRHFTVVWQKSNGSDWDVWMFRLTRDLAAAGVGAVSQAALHQQNVRIAYGAGAGRYLVVWQDARSGKNWDVYGQLVGRDGLLLGPPRAIYAGAFHDTKPAVAGHSSSSEFVVAFQRDITGADQYQVYGARVTGAGSVGQAFPIRLWYNVRWTPAIVHRTNSSEYVAAWTDFWSATQNDIQAQRFTSAGSMAGSVVNVSVGRKGQENPATAYNTVRNEYLVVWADYRPGDDYDLYARRVSPEGVLLGQELLVARDSFLYGVPEVAYDPNADEYLAVWMEITSPATGYDIYARRISGAGALRGPAFHVSRDTNAVNEGMPAVVFNSVAREYLVVWHAFTGLQWRIWGQIVSESGQLAGGNFVVSGSSKDAEAPRVTYNPARDEYMVVWLDQRNDRIDVYGHRLTSSGARAGADLAISTATGNKGRCDIDYNAADRTYLVVWGDKRNETSDIFGQMLDANANRSGASFPISASEVFAEVAPLVSWDPVSGRFLVAWWEFHNDTDYDVWAGTVSGTGEVAGDWFAVTEAREVQRAAKLSRGATNGTVLAVWQDFRNANYDIYGRLLEITGCQASATTLCLNNRRFSVTVSWRDFEGQSGVGKAVPITGDTGYFWFFNDSNVELVVKVLDGRGLNGFFWVYYGALSNVEYTMTVTDTETGSSKTYRNPAGNFASVGDTAALPGGSSAVPGPSEVEVSASSVVSLAAEVYTELMRSASATTIASAAASCTANGTTLCLNSGRFSVEVAWEDFQGTTGVGTAVRMTGDTGYFWFFDSANVELVLKVLDGRGFNNHFWVYYGALSNIKYTITVTDTQNGEVKQYVNPSGEFGSVGDTEAFYRP